MAWKVPATVKILLSGALLPRGVTRPKGEMSLTLDRVDAQDI